MRQLLFLFTLIIVSFQAIAQQGMGVGTNNPLEMLDVSGAIKIGTDINNSNVAPTGGAGTIRFRSGQFEGWDGSSWIPLGSGADADWTVSGNNTYSTNSANVGVGTTTPAKKMHVTGSILASGNASSSAGIELIPMSTTGNSGGRIFFREDNASDNFGFSLGFSGQNAPNGVLNWPANSFNISRHQGSSNGEVVLSIQRNSSNVGIGVTAAAERLHVGGSIRMVDGNQAAGYIPVSDANGTMVWTDPTNLNDGDWTVNGTNQYSAVSGNVGIGTTSPVHKLDINSVNAPQFSVFNPNSTSGELSGFRLQTGGGWGIQFQTVKDQSWFEIANSAGTAVHRWNAYNYHPGNSSSYLTTGAGFANVALMVGNLGVGTTSPSESLHIQGSIRMVDGNQAAGYIPVSDANGKMVWTDPETVTAAPIDELVDSDNDTKIQVEEIADEDIIRFDLAGTEHFTMEGPRLSVKNSGQSVFIGESAGLADDLTNGSTFIGYEAGMSNIIGFNSTAIGLGASRSTNADENTSVGAFALYSNQTGIRNTIVGTAAGQSILGSRNTIVGSFAGNNATGSQNVFLGYLAGLNETGDHKLYIENSTSSSPLIYGEFDNDIVGINGNLGVGTQSPQDELHVEGSIRMVDGNQAAGYLAVSDANGTMVWTDPLTISDGDWTISGNDIYNANNGNVGVGTTSPVTKLDVDGGGWFRTASGGLASTADDGVRVFYDATNNAGMIFSYDYANGSANNLVLQQPGGNVGVGIASPVAGIDVNGGGWFRTAAGTLPSTASKGVRLFYDGGTDAGMLFSYDYNAGTSKNLVLQQPGGNVGIGTSSPADELHVTGSIRMVDGNQATGRVPVSDANGTMTWTDRSNFIAYHKQVGLVSVTNGISTSYYNIAGLTTTTLSVQSGDIITLRAESVVRFTSGSGADDFYMRVTYGGCSTGNSEEKIIRFDEDGGHDNFTTLNYMDAITAPCTGTLWFRFQIKHVGDDPWEAVDGIVIAEKY